jgi:hypothetical protein
MCSWRERSTRTRGWWPRPSCPLRWSDLLAACRATGVSPQEYIANAVTIRLNRSTQAERDARWRRRLGDHLEATAHG